MTFSGEDVSLWETTPTKQVGGLRLRSSGGASGGRAGGGLIRLNAMQTISQWPGFLTDKGHWALLIPSLHH